MTIAYLGPEATFTHQAAIQKFWFQSTGAGNHRRCFRRREQAPRGLRRGPRPVPPKAWSAIRLDMFVSDRRRANSVAPIRYCLAGRTVGKDVQRLYAHPQALGQCRVWVQRHLAGGNHRHPSSARSRRIGRRRQYVRSRFRAPH